MTVQFSIPGRPFTKERPRFRANNGRVMTYTPKTTKEREDEVRTYYKLAGGKHFGQAPLIMQVEMFFPVPKSAPAAKKKEMLNGKILPTVKPDWDNTGKVICDALNGVAYDDDKQIVCAVVKKRYSEIARTDVLIIGYENGKDLLFLNKEVLP